MSDASGNAGNRRRGLVASLTRDWREIAPALSSLFTARRARPRRIDSADALPDALAREAAFLAQSSVYAYCRARTGFMGPRLFDESAFVESAEICAWHAYIDCLSDVFAIVEGRLRPYWPGPSADLADRLMPLYSKALRAHERRPGQERDWRADVQAFRDRLARLQLAAPLPVVSLVENSAHTIFDYLPIHDDLRRLDKEMVFNSVRFRFLRFAEDFEKKADFSALARELAGTANKPD